MEIAKPQGDFFDYIDIDAIDNRLHRIKEAKRLPVSDAPSRASRAVKSGSVLFSLVRPYLENIALIEEKHSQCIASTGFYVCNSNGASFGLTFPSLIRLAIARTRREIVVNRC